MKKLLFISLLIGALGFSASIPINNGGFSATTFYVIPTSTSNYKQATQTFGARGVSANGVVAGTITANSLKVGTGGVSASILVAATATINNYNVGNSNFYWFGSGANAVLYNKAVVDEAIVVNGTNSGVSIGGLPATNLSYGLEVAGTVSASAVKINGVITANDFVTIPLTDYSSPNSTIVGFSSLSVNDIKYRKNGKMVTVFYNIEGVSDSTSFTMTLPYQNNSGANHWHAISLGKNGGDTSYVYGLGLISNNSATVTFYHTGLTAWSNTSTKAGYGSFTYYTNQ